MEVAEATRPKQKGKNPGNQAGLTHKQLVIRRVSAMKTERSSWMAHWAELSRYQQPRLGRFFTTDINRGEKRHQSIYDRTAMGAHRTLQAGLQAGVSSPARPWFKLGLADKKLAERGSVKSWLHWVTLQMREIFAVSNTYRALHSLYGELGLFGTGATIVVEDYDNVIHHHNLTVGEYMLACDSKNRVNTLAREFRMTVDQVVEEFGFENCSPQVRRLYDNNQFDQWVEVVHLIEPNKHYMPSKADAQHMKISSCYWEVGSDDGTFLRKSGFKRFTVLAPRWEVTSGDIYGHSPGMEALGDVKQLQHQQLRKSQAIDYQVNPPLRVPAQYKDNPKARLPGGLMIGDGEIKSAFDVRLDLQHLREDIVDVRQRIDAAYYADLFLMISNDTRSNVTATEIAERHEEKLLMLGPVLERLHDELLKPLIDITFDKMVEAGIVPPIPPELEGKELGVEFISVLAQAQRIVSTQGMDRLFGVVGTLSQMDPNVLLKVDFAQAVDDYGDLYGVNPEIIVPDDVYEARLEQRARKQAADAAMQQRSQAAIDAKNLAGAPPEVSQSLMGYSTPGVM